MLNKSIPREIFPEIKKHLQSKEITVIIGPRQAGKTTLINQLQEYLLNKQNIKQTKIKTFNLDLIQDHSLLKNQADFIQYLKNEISLHGQLFVFIDEVQRLENPGKFLKGIYDLFLDVKFVVTGSSALEIKSKIVESLSGRKKIFKLYPFSFLEALSYKNPDLFKLIKNEEISARHEELITKHLYEILLFGSYPRVVLADTPDEKIAVLSEIYESYIEKDVTGFLSVKNPFVFAKLISVLSAQSGQLVNLKEIGNTLNINYRTLESYLSILEQTFVIAQLRPYFTNIRKELTKMPKIYFLDNGLRNFALKSFVAFEDNRDKGFLLENFIYSSLLKIWPAEINFWRTKDKSEVDFILRNFYGRVIPIEIKASLLKKPEITRGLKSFINKYDTEKAIVVNLSLQKTHQLDNCKVDFIKPISIFKFANQLTSLQ